MPLRSLRRSRIHSRANWNWQDRSCEPLRLSRRTLKGKSASPDGSPRGAQTSTSWPILTAARAISSVNVAIPPFFGENS